MRRASLLTFAVLAVCATAAQAKVGVEFDKYTEVIKPGEKVRFTVLMYADLEATQNAHPLRGRRPLITFRSESGAVVRVRATTTDLNGVGYGEAGFPDKGPWTTEMSVGGRRVGPDVGGEFKVGTGLTQTIPSADAVKARRASARGAAPAGAPVPDRSSDGAPWLWILSIAAIASGLLAFALRRRGRWGAV